MNFIVYYNKEEPNILFILSYTITFIALVGFLGRGNLMITIDHKLFNVTLITFY